jgi:hypothetical protein
VQNLDKLCRRIKRDISFLEKFLHQKVPPGDSPAAADGPRSPPPAACTPDEAAAALEGGASGQPPHLSLVRMQGIVNNLRGFRGELQAAQEAPGVGPWRPRPALAAAAAARRLSAREVAPLPCRPTSDQIRSLPSVHPWQSCAGRPDLPRALQPGEAGRCAPPPPPLQTNPPRPRWPPQVVAVSKRFGDKARSARRALGPPAPLQRPAAPAAVCACPRGLLPSAPPRLLRRALCLLGVTACKQLGACKQQTPGV